MSRNLKAISSRCSLFHDTIFGYIVLPINLNLADGWNVVRVVLREILINNKDTDLDDVDMGSGSAGGIV